MEEFWKNLPFDIVCALLVEGEKQKSPIEAIKDKAFYYSGKGPHIASSWKFLLSQTSRIYGKTAPERDNFWREVLKGNYQLYFNLPTSVKETIVNGEKFML